MMQDWPRAPGFGALSPHLSDGGSLNSATAEPLPPLPTTSMMEALFADSRAAFELDMHNNGSLTKDGRLSDTGYTGGFGGRVLAEKAGGSFFGVGSSMDVYTEHPRIEAGRETLGKHRDEELRVYASYGQQGAATQHIVDKLQTFLPWLNITDVSWTGRLGASGRTRLGRGLQNEIHHALATGGTLEKQRLADQYSGGKETEFGPYAHLSGYAGSRIGDSPLHVGLRALGEVAPAGTSIIRMGLEVQVGDSFYVKVGLAGSMQKSALGNFDGAPRDGAYPTALGAVGYQGDQGGRIELRVSQNPQGTGLGTSALGDERNLAASVFVRFTTDSLRAFLHSLSF